jgi:iron complex outermembrane receptor protein
VPAYLAVDLRVGWKPREQVELSMAGQNLFGTHSEFAGPSTRSELGPSVFFKILGRFL